MRFAAGLLLLPFALGRPSGADGSADLQSRDNPKVNQYRSLDDCRRDQNIISHASPAAHICVKMDLDTQAIFVNPGALYGAIAATDESCYPGNGDNDPLAWGRLATGKCIPVGHVKSLYLTSVLPTWSY